MAGLPSPGMKDVIKFMMEEGRLVKTEGSRGTCHLLATCCLGIGDHGGV